ncbi:unnamed protein product [Arabidopsis thaliana]|uniref:Phorbol-ester/DAG-type domain-containing protein n=1 Tax=Arabidopsis thaliana TaxID=3702 RepID=A0A654E6I6_ARATH|nr:unnamed protein product [Arabidopsis thaliana]
MEKDATEYQAEINHPWHLNHPLGLLENASDDVCLSCGELIEKEGKKKMCYGCYTCGDIILHLDCAIKRPSPHVVDRPNTHEHPLTLLTTEVSFNCNACGTKGKVSPYVCLSCRFMIHRDCINLPRVICINHHPHRLSHTLSLSSEKKLSCGVCHKDINSRYGAYLSTIDPDYVVHSRCAIRKDVWDDKELKGVPEEETLPDPFNVTSEERIKHFCHEEHELIRITDYADNDARCLACNLHVSPDPFYKCIQVNCGLFILHEKCANLPLEIRAPIHQHTLNLYYKEGNHFNCASCHHESNGFRYSCSRSECEDLHWDTKCVSITVPSLYGGHGHILYSNSNYITCCGCDETKPTPLSCPECNLGLCFACATLPNRLRYEDDVHPLFLNHGGNSNGNLLEDLQQNYWCDSCETQLDPLKYFYKCSTSCGTVIHTKCAIGGDLRNLRVGLAFNKGRYKYEVVPNDQVTRPRCGQCGHRGEGPSMFKCCSEDDQNIVSYVCSFDCLKMLCR